MIAVFISVTPQGGGGHGSTPFKYMKIYIYSYRCHFTRGRGLMINLFYRGWSFNYLSRESTNNCPIETVTSTLELVIFQGGEGGLISFLAPSLLN